MKDKIKELIELRAKLYKGGGDAQIEKVHSQGKYTARERIGMLLDEDTFQEDFLMVQHRCTDFGMASKELPADGMVTGRMKNSFDFKENSNEELYNDELVPALRSALYHFL